MTYSPDCGDIVWVDLSPQAGHELRGRHAALVLTPVTFSVATGLALIVPMTTKAKGSPFEVPMRGARQAKGVVLAHELRTIDYMARNTQKFDTCPETVLEEVRLIAESLLRPE